jgi:hypothetical protein
MKHGTQKVALFAGTILALVLTAQADQVSCAMIALNAQTFGNIGVWLPPNATPTGGNVQVRIITPPDNYSDCTNQGLCASPHSDIANVVHWDVPDQGGARGLGFTMFNAQGAPVKNVKVCYSYQMTANESPKGRLDRKILDLKPYDSLQELFKFKK